MDLRRVVNQLYPNQDDPSSDFSSYQALIAVWKSALPPPTEEQVNAKWAEIEAADALLQFEKDRQAEYEKQGLTLQAMVLAMWEKFQENDPKKADDLQIEKASIDAQYPKP